MKVLGSRVECAGEQGRSRAERQGHHDECRLGAIKPRNERCSEDRRCQDQSSQDRSPGHPRRFPERLLVGRSPSRRIRDPLRLRWQNHRGQAQPGRSQRRTMTFCTACASPIASPNQSCPTCGALHAPAVPLHSSRFPADAPAKRSILIRLLYLAPVLLLFAVACGLVQRHTTQQQWLASAYAAAEEAANAGDIVAAREGFMAIVGYRDAADRAREIEIRLEPLEADYLDGLQAIEH